VSILLMSRPEPDKKGKVKVKQRIRVVMDSDDDDEDKAEKKAIDILTDAYSAKTVVKYRKAVVDFINWCSERSIDRLNSYSELDETLFEYISDMYETKMADKSASGGKGKAAETIAGVIMYLPRAKWELMTAAKAVRNWNKISPPNSYPPLTKELTALVACQMIVDGHEAEAIGCVLAFDCLLRVGELASLRVSDVAFGDPRTPSELKEMVIRLRRTKTGREQSVVVRDPAVCRIVLDWKARISSYNKESFLFSFTADRFRRVLKGACSQLGLSSAYVPHSLRHGGATHMYLVEKLKVEDIMIYGRWAVLNSCKRYIQAGRALLLSVDVPSRAAEMARLLSRDLVAAFRASKKRRAATQELSK
jgi:integrase